MFRVRALFFLSFALAQSAYASDLTTSCEKVNEPIRWEYCLSKTEGSTNTDLVYHLHGAGENAHMWLNGRAGKAVREYWDNNKINAPMVVTVSFGPGWLLATKNASKNSGLYDVFTQIIMPYIENNVLHGQFGKRLVFGYSMGGFNGSQLFLKNPELFKKVVLGCPALATVSPYAPAADIDAYIARTKASRSMVEFMLAVVKQFYPDDASYQQDAPFTVADKSLSVISPPLHLSCGQSDGYGFHEGSEEFAKLAQSRGVQVTWVSLPGEHCVMDIPSAAAFLVN